MSATPGPDTGWTSGLLEKIRRWHEERQLAQRPIPDRLWRSTLVRYPFLARRSAHDLVHLRRLSSLFLARKEFVAAGGLRLTDTMAVAVAAQACLPVLRLGLDPYRDFVSIVLHPDAVVARREWTDAAGVVHQGEETLSGEAMERGPVMLSWRDVAGGGRSAQWGYNVVVHEFAHVVDIHQGLTSGRASGAAATRWRRALETEYRQFVAATASGEETLLDPYGCHSLAEFFAVASEVFFVLPEQLADEHPTLYQLLGNCFQQDPAAEVTRPG